MFGSGQTSPWNFPGEGKVSQTIVEMSVAYNIWVTLICGTTTAAMKKAVLCAAKFHALVGSRDNEKP